MVSIEARRIRFGQYLAILARIAGDAEVTGAPKFGGYFSLGG